MTTRTTSPLALIRAAIRTDIDYRAHERHYWRIDPRTRTDRMAKTLTASADADNAAKHAAMKALGVEYHGDTMWLTPENQQRAVRVLTMIERLSRAKEDHTMRGTTIATTSGVIIAEQRHVTL